MKSMITIFLLAGCLVLGLSYGKNKTCGLSTYVLTTSEKENATLLWHLDAKGLLWSLDPHLNKQKEMPWQRIWPDQLLTLIRDEKNMHAEKALVMIQVSPECSFNAVWKLLQDCAAENLATCLDEAP